MSSDSPRSQEHGRSEDLSFIRRVLGTTAWVGAVAALVAGVYLGWYWALSFAAGVLVGALNLVLLTVLIREIIRLGRRRWGTVASVLALKMPLVYGGLALLLIWRKSSAAGVMLGFSLPLVVIVMKAAGRALLQSGLFGGPSATKNGGRAPSTSPASPNSPAESDSDLTRAQALDAGNGAAVPPALRPSPGAGSR